jgi:hypothetical protein
MWNLTCDYPRTKRQTTMNATMLVAMQAQAAKPTARARRAPGTMRAGTITAIACLILGSGCGRPGLSQRTEPGPPPSQEDPPFHQGQYRDRASAESGSQLAVPADSTSSSAVPFRAASRTVTLPGGTLLTVQLDGSLYPAQARAGDRFTASIAGPITIDGETVIEPGTAVSGRVESAQAFPVQAGQAQPGRVLPGQGQGYVRLTLTAIVVDSKQLPLQTSSLFAGTLRQSGASSGSNRPESLSAARIRKGRRLTFRLTSPLSVNESTSMATLGPAR